MPFLDADTNYRSAYCDPCGGRIGGARLFCVDCVHKPTVEFDALDLCCEPQCVAASMPELIDLEVPHEPDHRLVKARIPVLLRHYGRVHSEALGAFERVRILYERLAKSTAHPQEEEKAGSLEKETPNHEPTVSAMLTNVERVENVITTPQEEGARPFNQETPSHQPTVAEMSAGVDKVDDVSTAQDFSRGGDGAEDSTSQHPTKVQIQDGNLPTCGNCKDRISFPFWYCIFCRGEFPGTKTVYLNSEGNAVLLDDLFICAGCDRAGVPKLMRSSGEHTEAHHLIRCQEPQLGRQTISPTEQLFVMDGRLNVMQMQLDDLTRRMGDHNDHIGDLNGRVGDLTGSMANMIGELTGSMTSLTSRIADIEVLLHRLVGTANGSM